jgi:hypothetical protein
MIHIQSEAVPCEPGCEWTLQPANERLLQRTRPFESNRTLLVPNTRILTFLHFKRPSSVQFAARFFI